MRIATFAASVWLTLLGTIALAQSVAYDYDRAVKFSKYKTYAWTRGTELTDELKHARAFEPSMARSFEGARAGRTQGQPDVLVAYHAS